MAIKRIPKPKITLKFTRNKHEWIITGADYSTNQLIEWKFSFDDILFRKFEKELSKILLKYETPEEEIRERDEEIRKLKLRFEGN